jgi:hypothetical protein
MVFERRRDAATTAGGTRALLNTNGRLRGRSLQNYLKKF